MVWTQGAKTPIALMLHSVLLGGQILSFKNLFSHTPLTYSSKSTDESSN